MARRIKALGFGLIVVLISGVGFAACQDDSDTGSDAGDGLTVVASTSIPAALVSEVGGDDVEVETLIEPGTDPHTFELTPGDIRTIADADLVLILGLGLDDYLLDAVEDGDGSPEVVVVTDGVELLEAGEHHERDEDEQHDHDDDGHDEDEDHDHEDDGHDEHEESTHDEEEHDHDHGEFDPHIWQDPLRVKMMVENISEALAEADPDNASVYRENAEAYQEVLGDTHAEIQSLIAEIPAGQRKLVTNHDAFAYFADRYAFEVVGTVIPGTSSEAEPSAASIAELTELIEDEGVRAIFAEALIEPNVAESLASDTGVEIVYGLYSDQVGEPGSGAETLQGMLIANATKISDALK